MTELGPDEKRAKNLRIVAYVSVVFGAWIVLLSLVAMALPDPAGPATPPPPLWQVVVAFGGAGLAIVIGALLLVGQTWARFVLAAMSLAASLATAAYTIWFACIASLPLSHGSGDYLLIPFLLLFKGTALGMGMSLAIGLFLLGRWLVGSGATASAAVAAEDTAPADRASKSSVASDDSDAGE